MEKGVWRVRYTFNGFEFPLFVEATEDELRGYMETELGGRFAYIKATAKQVAEWKAMHYKVYMA